MDIELSCTFIEPTSECDRKSEKMPCVVYLHSGIGNKIEGIDYCDLILQRGINFCTFDFYACGNSEGETISNGHFEQEDVKAVIEHLINHKNVSKIGLWGRDLGAATSLLYLEK